MTDSPSRPTDIPEADVVLLGSSSRTAHSSRPEADVPASYSDLTGYDAAGRVQGPHLASLHLWRHSTRSDHLPGLRFEQIVNVALLPGHKYISTVDPNEGQFAVTLVALPLGKHIAYQS